MFQNAFVRLYMHLELLGLLGELMKCPFHYEMSIVSGNNSYLKSTFSFINIATLAFL